MRDSWDRERDPLAALAAGDPAPFEDFVHAEAGTLLGFFQRMGADSQEAEDLTQEVFLKLFRSAAGYDSRQRFTAYCFRVARNAWIDRRRRAAARDVDTWATVGHDPGNPLERVPDRGDPSRGGGSEREESRRLYTALSALPESHRAVFELGAMQELSYAEVSSLLGIPVGTVKSRMFHAVRRLRDAMESGVARAASVATRAAAEGRS